MPELTLFERTPEEIQDMGSEEFAFVALRDVYNEQRSGRLAAYLKENGFEYGTFVRVRLIGRILNPLTGYDETFTNKVSEPTFVASDAAIVGVVRALLRSRLSLPMSGNESGVKDSEHVYYASQIVLSWESAPPKPAPTPAPQPQTPTPTVIESIQATVANVISKVKSFLGRLFGK